MTLNARYLEPVLTANDVDASLRFYVEGLGFEVVDRMEEDGKLFGAMLAAGNARLSISQDDFAKGRDRVKGVGMRLYLETAQDLETLARHARAAGISPEGPVKLPWGPLAITATDPDGFKVTITNPEEGA